MGTYLEKELRFEKDRIVVADDGTQVMMDWELPIMRKMAHIAAMRRGDVLEIGFGMGISATEVQRLRPRSHTIVEAHPQIQARARAWAETRPGVTILGGRWQDNIDTLTSYDGILFDVFGGDGQREAFFSRLAQLLRPHGTATLWLADDRDLSESMKAVLQQQGFRYSMTRVSAIPAHDCTYSRSNEFWLPTIFK